MPKVSVIVCTYNRDRLLRSCLSSLVDQSLNKDFFEVIVVNNNSTDDTQKIAEVFAEEYSNFRVVVEAAQGLSHARNRGYKEARGEYVAYIDDDAKASSDWIERILTAFETVEPEPVAVGGQYYPWYEQSPPSWFSDDMEIRTWGHEKGFLKPPRAQFGFSGSNMAFRKSVLQSYNGFSPAFSMKGSKMGLGDEAELFYRIYKESTLFWYDPEIIVLHFVPINNMTIGYRLKRSYHGGLAITAIKEGPLFYAAIKSLFFLSLELCAFLFKVRWWQKNWKRSFLKYAQPMAGSIGSLKACCQRLYG